MTSSHRIIINTAALYARVLVSTGLSVFASRYILAALGVVDFGLYSVIVGIMGFMSFLNGAMATSSQRHLTHALGRGNLTEVNRIFKTAFKLHAALAILLIVFGETLGLWFLTHILQIPDPRRDAAFWVFQFTVISTVCFVVAVPYQALLTAHEALAAVSLIGILQSFLGFFLALCIARLPGDHLVVFVLLSCLILISMTTAQILLCRLRYRESKLLTSVKLRPELSSEMLGVSGWSLVGSLSSVGRQQGLAFLLNIFFGPMVNAAFGIANQIGSMMCQLTQAMQQAISPRLMKQEGAGNRKRMLELTLATSKYGFFIACFWGIPLFAEMPSVLTLWLKAPPEHSDAFCRIILLTFACDQLSSGYGTAVLAIGKMARYQAIIGGIHLSTLPLAYILLKLGFNQNSVLLSSLITMIIVSASRGLVVRRLADLPYATWLNEVVLRGLAGVVPSMIYAASVIYLIQPSLGRLLFLAVTSGLLTVAGIVAIGMSRNERSHSYELLRTAIIKVKTVWTSLLPRDKSAT